MVIKELTRDEVHAKAVAALGLDPDVVDLTSTEAIACSLRRAAGFLCPCTAPILIQAVSDSLKGLVADAEQVRETIEDTLQALIGYGDLLEISAMGEAEGDLGQLICTAPPTFVKRKGGAVLLFGILPDDTSPLPEELNRRIEYVNHIRRLNPHDAEDLASELSQLGFIQLPHTAWLREPALESAEQHLNRLESMLDVASPSGEVSGLTLLDPATPLNYYRGRWVAPSSQTGRFVARRDQMYGAKLWCYIEMENGSPKRLFDLPLPRSKWRGCDEAWRLQATIDAQRGTPQRFRLHPGPPGRTLVDFFSPVPAWAQRRWDAIGDRFQNRGCLFSYCFANEELKEELQYIREHLWLAEMTDVKKR